MDPSASAVKYKQGMDTLESVQLRLGRQRVGEWEIKCGFSTTTVSYLHGKVVAEAVEQVLQWYTTL